MKPARVIVVGGGPAGMMAALRAANLGADVTLIDKNPSLGRKLLLTGKGRCNITNACGLDQFLERFPARKGQFLRDAFKVFFNRELMQFFESHGLKLKIERQKRVFPVTDRSVSVRDVLAEALADRVRVLSRTAARTIITDHGVVTGVTLSDGKKLFAEKVILATGGGSYSFTGSTGDGWEMARKLGHTIVDPLPGLVPLETKQGFIKSLSGVTLKNVRLKFCGGKNCLVSPVGELLFTAFGISGPLVLSWSGLVVDWLKENKDVFVEIDFKPALSSQQLDGRFLREFKSSARKSIKTVLKNFLPQRLIEVFLRLTSVGGAKLANQVTQQEREKLAALFKTFHLDIKSSLPLEEAMITRGGITLKEVDPRTMASRLVKGLYFAGEIIDVDGDTGGFNLQAAFSTGFLAGQSAAG